VGRSLLAAVLVAVAAAAGGCGDGEVREANAYVQAVNSAQSRFAARSQTLLAEIGPDDSRAHNRSALAGFLSAADGFVAELRRIPAPARVRPLHHRLISAAARFGSDLRVAGAAIVSHDASRVLRGQERLAAASTSVARRINATVAEINASLKR